MSEAKAMKLREYNTSVISHDLSYASNSDISQHSRRNNIRNTDTYKSRVLPQEQQAELARLNNKTAE
jgi:hypothetical protein